MINNNFFESKEFIMRYKNAAFDIFEMIFLSSFKNFKAGIDDFSFNHGI